MALSDIAAGLEVTTEQRDRGVASVDRTEEALADRLDGVAHELPCDAETAATLVEAYAAGKSVGDAGRAAGLAPMTAAKTLHRFGEQVCPLAPTARDVVRDWLDGVLSRSEALTLASASEREFLLTAYCETHEPVPDARAAVEGHLTAGDATEEKLASLGESVEAGDCLR
jgi:hypothetical protein